MALKMTVPGKSFVAGEYLAIEGGPSLVAALAPRFMLEATKLGGQRTEVDGVHPQSPAGIFYARHKEDFRGYLLKFIDPHQGAGGWGASTAQFAMLYALRAWHDSILADAERMLDLREMLGEYRDICKTTTGAIPSGADLVAQVRGGLTYFDRKKGQLKRFYWPFADIGMAFFRTGQKLVTHEHLQGLTQTKFAAKLAPPLVALGESLELGNQNIFIGAIKDFRDSLKDMGFENETTTEFVKELSGKDFSLAAKGCGAMGVDTLLVVYPQSKLNSLVSWASVNGLELVATERDLESGIDIKIEAGLVKGFESEAPLS